MPDHSTRQPPAVNRIPEADLRDLFNYANYWARVSKGELDAVVTSRHKPNSPNEPPGTESQLISIRRKDGFEVARVHAYVRPDGSLGASGKPDPKIVYDETGNVLYMQESKKTP